MTKKYSQEHQDFPLTDIDEVELAPIYEELRVPEVRATYFFRTWVARLPQATQKSR